MVDADEGEGEDGGEEERVALGEVVVPGVAAVEDGQRLRDVVVEEAGRGEGPGLVVDAVDDGGEEEDSGAGWEACYWRVCLRGLGRTYPQRNASRIRIIRSLLVARVREGSELSIEVIVLNPRDGTGRP